MATSSSQFLGSGISQSTRRMYALVLATTVGMFVMNGLAASGVISGQSIGGVSDVNNQIITPAGYAFSIWGVIYFGLAIFVLLPFIPLRWLRDNELWASLHSAKVPQAVILTNALNASWIVVFSFGARSKAALWLSAVLLLCLVATLMIILERARAWLVVRKTFVHVIALDATFSLYAGWCTVASIVNVTVALASTGWTGHPWTPVGWTLFLLVAATVISLAQTWKRGDGVFGLAVAWALIAIARRNRGVHDDVAATSYGLAAAAGVAALASVLMYIFGCSRKA